MDVAVNILIWVYVAGFAIAAVWLMATLVAGLYGGVVVGLHSLIEWLRTRKRGYAKAAPPADPFGP